MDGVLPGWQPGSLLQEPRPGVTPQISGSAPSQGCILLL